MDDFTFTCPTKIIFGKDKELEIGKVLKSYNVNKIAVVYGKKSVIENGLLERILNILDEEGITHYELGGVLPNPDIEFVRTALKKLKEEPVELILAIGGGSVIDTVKSMANSYYYDGDPYDLNLRKFVPQKALKVGVILTISAAGSEMSTSCVMSERATNSKRSFNNELARPLFAILNPELTYSVSKYQTACGVVDILMHTLERYFNESTYNELADYLAEGLLKSVIDAGWKAFKNPNDYDARATLMLASSLSHNGLTSLGKKSYMPVHQLEHALSGLYDEVTHGAGLSVLFIAWAKYYVKIDTVKFAKFARNVFNVDIEDPIKCAKLGIERLEQYFKLLEMPLTYKDLGLENVDIDELVKIMTYNYTREVYHHIHPMDKDVAKEIFMLGKGE